MQHPNQLQFNLDVVTNPENMRTQFSSPSAFTFERILQKPVAEQTPRRSPIKLKAVSSSKLSEATELAKRDIRLAKRKKTLEEFAKENALDATTESQNRTLAEETREPRMRLVSLDQVKIEKKKQKPRPKIQHTISPPKISKHKQEMLDIKRLRLSMQQLIISLEKDIERQQVLHRQKLLMLDQEQEQKLIVRHLEQMRKSSRTVYTLQQQTEVIKGELKKSSGQGPTGSSKSRPLSKLAAAHRGAARLLQVYFVQLPEHLIFSDNIVAVIALFQQISKLIKELSLCSLQFDLASVEEVERVAEALKNLEPTFTRPQRPASSPQDRRLKTPQSRARTPQRSFKSKGITLVKKPHVQPKATKQSFSPAPRLRKQLRYEDSPTRGDQTDLYDRREWRPPSNSPHKDVGPPSLGPLLESPKPTPARATKPKQVKFFRTLRQAEGENDIDAYEPRTPRDLRVLKTKLADELEVELKNRINPLLKKVEDLAKSAHGSDKASGLQRKARAEEEILESQVRDIIDETRKEMRSFQRQQEVDQDALHLSQRPSLESLLLRLDTINKEEEAIRRRWKEINYEDTRPSCPAVSPNEISAPKTPQPFKFTKTSSCSPEEVPKNIVNFLPEGRDGNPSSLVVRRPPKNQMKRKVEFSGRTLTLPKSTLNAIRRNKREFERHLKYSFHESKGSFDPWKLVEELSDNILDEVVTTVAQEVNGLCEDYAEDIFQKEFANASLNSEQSLTTTSESSTAQTPPPRR